MAWERFTETPALLREGHYLHFLGPWDDNWKNGYFQVVLCQQIDVERAWDIAKTQQYEVSFESPATGGFSANRLSLIPENGETVYEILMGIKGLPIAYPRYNNRYFLQLETTSCLPDPTDTNHRAKWLGYFSQKTSPFGNPLLREYTIKDQSPPSLELFNDFVGTEHIGLRFIVNRCRVKKVEALTEEQRRRAREIQHFSSFIY
jgi:hypothetical protein